MFSKVKTFAKNHWKKALYGGIAIQVASYSLRYAANKVMQYQQDQTKEMWLKMKKREHFERTYSNSVTTFLTLLPTLRETISKTLNVDVLTAALKEKGAYKLQIWEEMKCLAFSRVLSSIYGCTILNILLRIQLSVIGGYMIQDSITETVPNNSTSNQAHSSKNRNEGSSSPSLDAEFQHDYLSLANYFVNDGMQQMCVFILQKTKQVVGSISLKRKLSIQEIEQVLWHIIDLIRQEGAENPTHCRPSSSSPVNYWEYIFPPDIVRRHDNFRHHGTDPAQLPEEPEDLKKQIICETYDLLQSNDATSLISSFETHGVSHFLDQLTDIIAETQPPPPDPDNIMQVYKSCMSENSSGSSLHSASQQEPESNSLTRNYNHLISDVTVPLAKLIPIFNSFSPSNLKDSDAFVMSIIETETLRVFAANIYESFSSPISVPL